MAREETWGRWFLEFGRDTVRAGISEALAFSALALVIAWMFKKELLHAMEKGLRYVGDSLSTTFVTYVLPEITRGREAIEKHLAAVPVLVTQRAAAPPEMEVQLKNIDDEIARGTLVDLGKAETRLLHLREEHPDSLAVLQRLVELYWHPKYNKPLLALEILKNAEDTFRDSAKFYQLIASTYVRLKGDLPTAFKYAVDAAKKSIELEPSGIPWRRMLGYVYYWFGDIERAIPATEEALKLAEEQQDAAAMTWTKNNLAFYYAVEGKAEKREAALAYAREAYDENDPATIDSLGFVLLRYPQRREDLLEAIRLFNRALEIRPGEPTLEHLSEAYAELKKYP